MSKWISVDDDFPKWWIDGRVIAYIPSAYNKIDIVLVCNAGGNDSKFQHGWNKGESWEATHWMPLPKLPKRITRKNPIKQKSLKLIK